MVEAAESLSRPTFGPRYSHFTDNEIHWIHSVLVGKPGRGDGKEFLILGHRALLDQYPDLREFENLPVEEQLSLNRITNSRTRQAAGRIVLWLANYGRVQLSLPYLEQRHLKEVPNDLIPLVNTRAMEYLQAALDELGEANPNRVRGKYWRFLLWAGQPLDEAVKRFEEFYAQYKNPGEAGVTRLRTIFLHKGLPVAPEPPREGDPYQLHLLETSSPKLLAAYKSYVDFIQPVGAYGTWVQKKRNMRIFLDWLDEEYSDLQSLADLKRFHIREFVANIAGEYAPHTRNTIVATLKDWFDWLRDHAQLRDIAPGGPLVNSLDRTKEYYRLQPDVSPEEMRYLFRVIQGIEEDQDFLVKMALLLMMDTGARLHEVLHLDYDCLYLGPGGVPWIRIRKRKQQTPHERPAGQLTIQCVERLRSYQEGFKAPLATQVDPKRTRRLFVSKLGRQVMREYRVYTVLSAAQLKAGLSHQEDPSEPRYSPHDLRRIYVTALQNAGTPDDIIRLLTGHSPRTRLTPYELGYEKANQTFAHMDSAGVLTGKPQHEKSFVAGGIARLDEDILSLLRNRDVRERQRVNQQRAEADPLVAFPLITGKCIGRAEIDCWNGPLSCFGCQHFEDIDPEAVDNYLRKLFFQQWQLEKHGISLPMIDPRIEAVVEHTYVKKRGMTRAEASAYIEQIRLSVRPRRGRPKKGEVR